MWKIYSRFRLFLRLSLAAWKSYWSHLANRLYLLISIFSQFILWWWSFNIYRQIDDSFLIFHYTVDFGISLIGNPYLVFILPGLALFFNLLNLIFSLILINKKQAKVYKHLFGLAMITVNIILLLSLFSIHLINFRF